MFSSNQSKELQKDNIAWKAHNIPALLITAVYKDIQKKEITILNLKMYKFVQTVLEPMPP